MKKEKKKELKKFYLKLAIIVFIIIVIDQLAKFIIANGGEINLIDNKIILKQADTIGEYDETARSVNILTNIVAIAIIFGIIKGDNQFVNKKTKIFLSFAFAGGVSNILDRILRGNVIEFIHIGNLPIFNIADICILIGWIYFVAIFASFSARELSGKKLDK